MNWSTRHPAVALGVAMALIAAPAPAMDQVALTAVTAAVRDLCLRPNLYGYTRSIENSGGAGIDISAVLRKIVTLGAHTELKTSKRTDYYDGVLARDLARSMESYNGCVQNALKTLTESFVVQANPVTELARPALKSKPNEKSSSTTRVTPSHRVTPKSVAGESTTTTSKRDTPAPAVRAHTANGSTTILPSNADVGAVPPDERQAAAVSQPRTVTVDTNNRQLVRLKPNGVTAAIAAAEDQNEKIAQRDYGRPALIDYRTSLHPYVLHPIRFINACPNSIDLYLNLRDKDARYATRSYTLPGNSVADLVETGGDPLVSSSWLIDYFAEQPGTDIHWPQPRSEGHVLRFDKREVFLVETEFKLIDGYYQKGVTCAVATAAR